MFYSYSYLILRKLNPVDHEKYFFYSSIQSIAVSAILKSEYTNEDYQEYISQSRNRSLR